MKTAEINFKITLDENNLPVNIEWNASDSGGVVGKSKAIMLAMWDEKEMNTLRFDLWTKDMGIDEMKQFFHQNLLTMSDTFKRATGEENISEDLKDYCAHFAEKMELKLPPGSNF
jgi:gliding motility-associated protein GldC